MSQKSPYQYLTRKSPPDSTLTPYSHSILDAVTQCPMWGVIRYGHRKHYANTSRAMALEYGAAAHEVFAAIYLWQLGFIQKLPEHMHHHATRIFKSDDRFSRALVTTDKNPDPRDALISLGYNILHTSDFYNDPMDYIRTIENLEVGIIKYVENVLPKMERWPIWVADRSNPTAPVGIEVAFDMELVRITDLTKIQHNGDKSYGFHRDAKSAKKQVEEVVRYVGQLDRLHEVDGEVILGENKTGSRLDQSWAAAFDMSHQLTGYLLAVYTILGKECVQSKLHGLKTKQTGHSDDYNPIDPKDRDEEMFATFIDWAIHSKEIYDKYMDNWERSPRYTHSCNRYFRSCSLLTFCTDTVEGRKEQFEEMTKGDLSPSEQAVLDKIGMLDT